MDVIHTAVWVDNIERTIEFYTEGLELDVNWEVVNDGVQYVYIGGEHGEIQCKYDPDADYETGAAGGFDHIAIGVENTDEAFETLCEREDPPVHTPPITLSTMNRRIAFVEDPDGYVVELVQQLD